MSFDIFMQCFRNGEPAPISRELFESIFLPHATHPESYKADPGYFTVKYPDGSGGAIYCDDVEKSGCVMVNHCGGKSFWADFWELADHTGSVIFWPSEKAESVVTNEATLKELPKDVPDFAAAKIARDGDEVAAVIEAN